MQLVVEPVAPGKIDHQVADPVQPVPHPLTGMPRRR
jgi:hypothetical protein